MRELIIAIPSHFLPSQELTPIFGIQIVDPTTSQRCQPSTITIKDQAAVTKIAQTYRDGGFIKLGCPICGSEVVISRDDISKRNLETAV